MIIFLLAHAGGSAAAYLPLFPTLATTAKLVPLELPGHGGRIGERLLDTVEAMLCALQASVDTVLAAAPGESYMFFGHSMGSLLAFLLTQAQEAKGRGPAHLVVSSGAVPGRHYVPEHLAGLSDRRLWEESAAYFGGMTEEALSSDELMALFIPLLRADLHAVITYRPVRNAAVSAPITALYGEEDVVDEADMDAWRRHTTGVFFLQRLPGNHFHLLADSGQVERIVIFLEELCSSNHHDKGG